MSQKALVNYKEIWLFDYTFISDGLSLLPVWNIVVTFNKILKS